MTSFRLWTHLIGLLIALSSCSFQDPSEAESKEIQASFQVGTLSAIHVESVGSQPVWGLPNKKIFHLRACLIDGATGNARSGERFLLWQQERSQVLEADLSGCVEWSEEIAFLPLAPENYVSFSRKLEGAIGSQTLRFAINPWSTNASFVDLTRNQHALPNLVPEAEQLQALRGVDQYRPEHHTDNDGTNLRVEHLELEFNHSPNQKQRHFKGTFKVLAERARPDGSFSEVELPGGSFKLSVQFLSVDPQTRKTEVWAAIHAIPVQARQGVIVAETDFTVLALPEETAIKKVHFILEPTDASIGLLAARGDLLLMSLSGKSSGTPLPSAQDYRVTVNMLDETRSPSLVIAKKWNLTFGGETDFNPETGKVAYRVDVEVCVVDALNRLPIVGHTFVVGMDRATQEGRSDENGCLFWGEEKSYSVYQAEQYFDSKLVITTVQAPYADEKLEIKTAVNPWSSRNGLFFWDTERKGAPTDFAHKEPPVISSDGYRFTYVNPYFDLNHHLQLISHHNYQVKMRLDVHRPGRNDGLVQVDKVRSKSKFKVRGLLLHPLFVEKQRRAEKTPESTLSGFETVGEVDQRGELNFLLSLPIEFSQQALVDSRTQLLVSLEPVVAAGSASIDPITLLSTFKVVAGQRDTDDAIFSESDLTNVAFAEMFQTAFDKAQTEQRTFNYAPGSIAWASHHRWTAPALPLYLEYWRQFTAVDAFEASSEIPKEETQLRPLNEFVEELSKAGGNLDGFSEPFPAWVDAGGNNPGHLPDEILGRFCLLLTAQKSVCLEQPKQFFHISSFKAIESIQNQRLNPPSVSTPLLQLAATFFREFMLTKRESEGIRNIREHATSYSAKVGLGAYDNGGSRTSAFIWQNEDYDTLEVSVQSDFRVRNQFQEQQNLSAEGKTFEFNATYRNCVLIRPFARVVASSNARGFLFCSTLKSGPLSESWYYIWDQWRQLSSSHVDPRDPWQRGWLKLIRGRNNYESFKNLLANGPRYYVLKKVEPMLEGVDGALHSAFFSKEGLSYQKDGGTFPGITNLQEGSLLLWTEQRINELTIACSGEEPGPGSTPAAQSRFAQKQIYCRCLYEAAARTKTYGEYEREISRSRQELTDAGIPQQCVALSKKELP